MHIAFDNTYARELPGAYVAWKPAVAPSPELLYLNRALADELGLDGAALASAEGAAHALPATRCPKAPSPSRRPTPATSSAASRRSWATAARCCWAR